MTDLRWWLEDLDLAQYADTFEKNGVDAKLVPEITNEDRAWSECRGEQF